MQALAMKQKRGSRNNGPPTSVSLERASSNGTSRLDAPVGLHITSYMFYRPKKAGYDSKRGGERFVSPGTGS